MLILPQSVYGEYKSINISGNKYQPRIVTNAEDLSFTCSLRNKWPIICRSALPLFTVQDISTENTQRKK